VVVMGVVLGAWVVVAGFRARLQGDSIARGSDFFLRSASVTVARWRCCTAVCL